MIRQILRTAAALAAAVAVSACTVTPTERATDPSPTTQPPEPSPSVAAIPYRDAFEVAVPDGWQPSETAADGVFRWVGPSHDDGTRLGLSVSVRCLELTFDEATDRLQSSEGNWEDYQVAGEPEAVDVAGAERAERWQAHYTLPDPQIADARALLLTQELLAVAEDRTAVLVQFESRDRWFDPTLAAATLDSVTIAPIGCDGS